MTAIPAEPLQAQPQRKHVTGCGQGVLQQVILKRMRKIKYKKL